MKGSMELEREGDNGSLIRYLLGEPLPPAELDRLEQGYFTDDAALQRLAQMEDALIQASLSGRLTAEESERFEKHFLSSERRRRKYHQQLAAAGGRHPVERPAPARGRWWLRLMAGPYPWRVAVAAVLLLAFGVTMYLRLGAGRRPPAAAPMARLTEPAPVVFSLSPGLQRSREGHSLRLPPAGKWVRLELRAETSPGASYAAALTTVEGESLWTQARIEGGQGMVPLLVPAGVLLPGDYVLALTAVKDGVRRPLPAYSFRIERSESKP